MGKGDIKTKRGKIANGSYGVRRQKPTASGNVTPPNSAKAKGKTKSAGPSTAKKTEVKKTTAKKASSKKTAE
ncbi:MAG: ribosomal protein Thx [Bacteroidota bacterium]|jgi:30S ribosomal protein S31